MIYSQDPDRVSAPQCLCHKRSVLLHLLHANLLQFSNTASTLPKTILQSTDEENIFVHCERRGLLCSNCSTHCNFPPKIVFLSKLYPIQQNICISNHTPDYSTLKSPAVAVSVFQRIQIPKGSEQYADSVIFKIYSTNFQ